MQVQEDLARVLIRQGKLAEAEPLFRSAVAFRRRSWKRLAWEAEDAGRLADAEAHYREALKEAESMLLPGAPPSSNPGADRATVLESQGDLAKVLLKEGKYAEAEPYVRGAIALRELSWGPEHPAVAEILETLAVVLAKQGKDVEAEAVLRRALAIREKALGGDHADVVRTRKALTEVRRRPSRSLRP